MNHKDFDEIVKNRLNHCNKTLTEKSEEYSRNGERLHNFYTAARMDNCTPFESLWGMWMKHIVSVSDMVEDCVKGRFPSAKVMDDKFTDMIAYTCLLEGLIADASKKIESAK